MHSSSLSAQSHVQSLHQLLRQLVVPLPTAQVRAGKLKLVVLVPVLERQLGEGGSVGKLEVSKVPVQDLSVSWGEVHSTGREGWGGGGGGGVTSLVSLLRLLYTGRGVGGGLVS